MLALRQGTVRLLIADDVGVGKTVEAGLIAAELMAQGEVDRLAVLCSPALAEQWQRELAEKFNLDATLVLASTAARLERGLAMDESLFDRHPVTVVSTDFIKSERRRHDFLKAAPELVIVDEAHTAVTDSDVTGRGRHQRYELMKDLASDPVRHLVLVTATPHSGKDEGFRNLIGLLDPELATVDLDSRKGREHLAQHMIQRRRKDIRDYVQDDLHETTVFPDDRLTSDVGYRLTPAYRELFAATVDYAREQVTDTSGGVLHQRVRWWSALGLLRALASSPAAAAQTMRSRAEVAGAEPDLPVVSGACLGRRSRELHCRAARGQRAPRQRLDQEVPARRHRRIDELRALSQGQLHHAAPLQGQASRHWILLSWFSRRCLLYTSPSPRDGLLSRMPSSA